jgi:hypothetical protein
VIAIVFVIVLMVSILSYWMYRYNPEDYDDGELILHDREYVYTISIQNVTGAYEVIVPIVVMRSGVVLDLMDFEEMAPDRCEVVETEYGLGLRIWGVEPFQGTLRGEYTGLRESELGDYGYPFFSTMEGDVSVLRPWEEEEVYLWMYSNRSNLDIDCTVRTDSHRDWVNMWGQVTWTSGGGSQLVMSNTTALDWNLYSFEFERLYTAN